jgi:hypothetical protein
LPARGPGLGNGFNPGQRQGQAAPASVQLTLAADVPGSVRLARVVAAIDVQPARRLMPVR